MQKLFTVAVLTGAAQAISMKSMVKEEKMTRAQEDEMVCGASKDEVWAMFDATNTNGDEFLQYGEAKAMVEHMQEKGSASAEAVLHNFDELGEIFDKDNDNQMSWEEFHSGSKCLFGRPKYSWAIEFVENNDDKTGQMDDDVAVGYVCHTLEENKDFDCEVFLEDIMLADKKDGHQHQSSFKTLWQALKKNKKRTVTETFSLSDPSVTDILGDPMDDAPLTAPMYVAPMYEMTREEEDAMVCQASTKDIESVFRQVDADNSGKIDLAEGVAHLEKESGISAQLALENLHEMGPLLDMNKDEGVDLDEFLAAAVCSFGKPKYSWMIDFVSNNDEETGMINAADAIGYLCFTLHQEEAFDCGKFAHGVMESAETSFPSVWSALLNSRM